MTRSSTGDRRRPRPGRLVAVVGSILLLLIGVGLAILAWRPGLGLIYAAAVFLAAFGLVALIITILVGRGRAPIIGAGAAVVVIGLVATLAVPAVVRQAELRGHGVHWRSSLTSVGSGSGLRPAAAIDDAVLLHGDSTLVVVGLADGAVRGTVATGPVPRILAAGDRFVVEDGDRFQLYDAAGQPSWPEPIAAQEVLGRRAGVTVLWNCDPDCTITGYADSGQQVWQRPGPRGGGGLHHPYFGVGHPRGLAALPDRFALRERSGYGWRVIDAANGRELGREVGHAAHLTTGATVVLRSGGRAGTCRLTIDAEARGGRTVRDVPCRDPKSAFIRGRLLVLPVGGTAAQLHPLDRDAAPIEVDHAERLLSPDYPTVADDVGMAGLAPDRVEGWAWPRDGVVTGPPNWTRERPPIEPDTVLGSIFVHAGTAVIAGAAERQGPYDQRQDSWVTVYDVATGAETARVRVAAEEHSQIRLSEVLPLRPGCAVVVAEELLLLGTC